MTTLRACALCARPFSPAHHTHRKCDACAPDAWADAASPSSRAGRDPAYRRNRTAILASNPACTLRILCDGAPATTADHITPVAHGGTHDLTNLRPACQPCNASRGATPDTATQAPTATQTPRTRLA